MTVPFQTTSQTRLSSYQPSTFSCPSMKIVHFADLHLDIAFSWMSGSPDAARKRRQALRDTLLRIIELTSEVGAEALICGGDLYEHDRFSTDTGSFLSNAFESLDGTRVFIAPGNHDWYGPKSLYRVTDWSPNVHIFENPQLTPVTLTDGLTLWGAAHRGPANTPGFLEDFHLDREGIHLGAFHGSERSWFNEEETDKQRHAPFEASQIESAGLHHALLGHFHRPRDHEWFTYPGNPDPLTFGEDGKRGAVVVTVRQNGSVLRERVVVAVSQTHDLRFDVSGAESQQDIRNRVLERVAGLQGSARITLYGELAPTIDIRTSDLSALQTSLDSLVVAKGNLHVAYDLDSIAEEQTVRGEFVRSVSHQGLSDDERIRVLLTGLRALDGREDLEVF